MAESNALAIDDGLRMLNGNMLEASTVDAEHPLVIEE